MTDRSRSADQGGQQQGDQQKGKRQQWNDNKRGVNIGDVDCGNGVIKVERPQSWPPPPPKEEK